MIKYLVEKYIKLCNLLLLEKIGNNYLARCPICKDSQKKRNKKRFYILLDNNRAICYCHNCGYNISFERFLKEYNSAVYHEYIIEKLQSKTKKINKVPKEESPIENIANEKYLSPLNKIINIKEKNDIINFLKYRKLPLSLIKELYYTDDFRNYVNTYIKNKFSNPFPEARIIMPIFNKNNKLIAIQGRSINSKSVNYITVSITDEIKLWNINKIINEGVIYVFEGIFDACFFKNAIATLGSSFAISDVRNMVKLPVFSFDNDFRYNKQIYNRIEKIIKLGEKVVIFPKNYKWKDINEAIMKGFKAIELEVLLKKYTFQGYEALVHLNM